MSTIELGTLQAELGAILTQNLGGFTLVTVEADYSLQGNPLDGTITFTLTQPLTNGDLTVLSSPLTVDVDAEGQLSVTLVATDDPATVPQGVWYGVTEMIANAQPRDYFIQIATGSSQVQLSSLMPGQAGWQ